MLKPDELKAAFAEAEDENWLFRGFLKEQNPEKVDRLFRRFHGEYFGRFDCNSCLNCCKNTAPVLNNDDIRTISCRLGMTAAAFTDRYLKESDEGMEMKEMPCAFLTESGCAIYDFRPLNCKEYPYTDKAKMTSRLINVVKNCEICPVVFEIVERMKNYYTEGFEAYKEEQEI